MIEGFGIYWMLVGVVPLLILGSLALNYRRARKWNEKAREKGAVLCRTCGYLGVLNVRTLSAAGGSTSSNLRLVCARCSSYDWVIPDKDQGP